jgi:hypothetical protein
MPDNQRKKRYVKRFRRVSGGLGEWVLIWGFTAAGACWGGRLPDAGMGNSAPGRWPFCGAVAVPVTRVFSPYVVQAGSARPRVRAGLLLQRSTGLVRRSGRPGESCPGLSAR